ncbi:MAG: MFS transporter [Micrococcales bacterium 73-13]|nr:MAG: MFS transporter [Micrococcales bacterium 73-13]
MPGASAQETVTDPRSVPTRRFFGQPWALVHIFGVETWERFSWYGMQAILLYYMYYTVAQGGLGIPQSTAGGIMGAYAGSVYLSTILAAWISDRVLGAERTLFYSAITVALGHVAMAVLPAGAGLAIGLVLIALGSGGVKSNASAIVGKLYAADDPRRDAGFALYYLGINLGGFLGPLLTGWLQSSFGFHIGFGAAAVGMAFGLVQYWLGRRGLPEVTRQVPNPVGRGRLIAYGVGALAVVGLVALLIALQVLDLDELPVTVTVVSSLAAIMLFAVILSSPKIDATERSRVWAFVPLFIVNVGIWSVYLLSFTLTAEYGNDRTNLDLFGWQMPPAWVQSINPIFILILSSAFAAIWTKLGRRQPSTVVKWVLGFAAVGIAYLLFLPFIGTGAHGTPLLAVAGIILVWTIGELLFSPTGLALTTKLSPRAFTSQMFALYFLSLAVGGAVSGTLAQLYDEQNEGPYFLALGIGTLVLAAVTLAISPWVLRLMRGVR